MEEEAGPFDFRGVVCEKEKSDCHCWGFEEEGSEIKRLDFKLPELEKNEIRMKVTNVGLCQSDVMMAEGAWMSNCYWPLVPGHEMCGIVEKVGSKVKGYKVGEKVMFGVLRECCGACEYCLDGKDNCCVEAAFKPTYDPYLGGYSTYFQAKSEFFYHMNPELDAQRAPPLLCAGVTVFAPLQRHIVPQGVCGVVGIGGLGHMAIQYANKMGMKVIAISTTSDKEREAMELGAHQFVCSTEGEQMKGIKNYCDIVVNTCLAHDITSYLYTLKSGGTFIQVAVPQVLEGLLFDSHDLIIKHKTIAGGIVGSRREVQQMLDFSAFHNIQPIVQNYSWNDFPKAYDTIKNGKPRFRCVVDIADTFTN